MKLTRLTLTGIALTSLLPALWMAPARSGPDEMGDAADAEQQLGEIRAQIEKLEQQITGQVAERGDAEQALRTAERQENGVRKQLKEVAGALATTQDRLVALEADTIAIRAELSTYAAQLEQQLRTAYVSGRDDWLRAVLSLRDPAEIGRQLVYHSYIAKQRSELIGSVRASLEQLADTQTALDAERARLEQTLTTEQVHLVELSDVRQSRNVALTSVNAGIASRNDQVERLRTEAEGLEELVAELTRIIANLPVTGSAPFSERKGRMEMPATGRIIRKFGQSRADGRLRWEGILVGAPAGEEVRAVHYGRVVYSDWLPGMGLLVVLEHGDGFLSLYGHNQDVVVAVGEWADPGAVIAHVGDSGGQAATGLYFEIRKNGKPQNPGQWLMP